MPGITLRAARRQVNYPDHQGADLHLPPFRGKQKAAVGFAVTLAPPFAALELTDENLRILLFAIIIDWLIWNSQDLLV